LEQVLPRYEAGAISGSANNIRHYIGEAYFFRAQEYFYRYQLYGDFPIIEETLPDVMETLTEASKRQPRNEVARFILSDLDQAIELMATTPDSRKTRINKETALLLKSRVALYEGTFLKYFKGTAFVPGNDNWAGAAKDYNRGYTFPTGSIDAEINWFLDQAIAAAEKVADAVALTPNTGMVQQDATEPANPYMDMYADEDLSGISEVLLWREYSHGLSVMHRQDAIEANFNIGVTRGFTESFLMANGLPIYAAGSGYAGDNYIADVRKNRDNRLFLFLVEPGQKNILYPDPLYNSFTLSIAPYPTITGLAQHRNVTGYWLRKENSSYAKHYTSSVGQGSYTGIIYFRGVEAHLNYIEAWYERHGSVTGKAASYWQTVRNRAKLDPDFNKTIAATVMDKEALNDWGAYSAGQLIDPTLYNIRRERRCEFIGEGMRAMDLQRWRAMDQMITTPYHIEGFKLWGPMKSWYPESTLVYGLSNSNAVVSPPDRSNYLRPYEISGGSQVLDGYRWAMAHYLNPIGVQHVSVTSKNGDLSTSPIYQNPGWSLKVGEGALE
jgi:hypothetical protein